MSEHNTEQINERLKRVEHLRREITDMREQKKKLSDEIKALTEELDIELDAVESIRNGYGHQNLLTSEES
jgi:predicted nuclease with TOPRIM domain